MRFYKENGRFAFLIPLYNVHLRLIAKRVVNLVLIELFCWVLPLRRCATSEYRLKIGIFVPTRSALHYHLSNS